MAKNKITVKERNKISILLISDITHITCSGYLSTIHTICGKRINVAKPLKEYENELSEFDFIRINHCTLVNFQYVTAVQLGKLRTLLVNNTSLKISRRKMQIVTKFLKNN
ncbi:MAG: LytTR family transcriptional regulator [Prevotellaceae bacterium]|nr:LytTR family transcriptional regulator [Prevotellaceae bacterium]